jgi:hypothetical protein
MIGEDVKQVRCTTCDADHAFKHAKVPRQRRKTDTPAALYAQVLASGPKRVVQEAVAASGAVAADNVTDSQDDGTIELPSPAMTTAAEREESDAPQASDPEETDADAIHADGDADGRDEEEGPVHRPLIRASLPKIDGQPPPSRQMPEFTIRQPGGRPSNRFRPRHQAGGAGRGGGQQFQGNRSTSGNTPGGPRGGMRSNGGRPPQGQGGASMRRHGPGRKRSK